ncbi:vesicle-associated membrane protein/synaptobrevin-binding protein [Homalodisca vitripennis]|uniref:MSP domain-containing protein n=2 Tax=Homalodisca liturata TaxID=320908 RepID=A0A1B6HWG0_9HEMI|nr:vesicle-associated membrane protein/synaptobrevin-binding protein [Homalodisca vitripennis]
MAKQEQILIIDPLHELKFRGPFTVPVTSYMRLTNPSNNRVCFKIKTTAPKKYCVRPNSGLLNPKDVMEIAVSLQPFEFDPTEKNKHKFMVQTLIAPEGEVNLEALWKGPPETLMDSKLKCVFEMPVEENTVSATSQETSNAVEDKTKRVGDSPSVAHDGDLVKAAKEVKHLREEESSLRQENLQLKEQLMRLRLNHQLSSPPPAPSSPSLAIAPAQGFSPLLIITAIAMAIVGIILGKYIL